MDFERSKLQSAAVSHPHPTHTYIFPKIDLSASEES